MRFATTWNVSIPHYLQVQVSSLCFFFFHEMWQENQTKVPRTGALTPRVSTTPQMPTTFRLSPSWSWQQEAHCRSPKWAAVTQLVITLPISQGLQCREPESKVEPACKTRYSDVLTKNMTFPPTTTTLKEDFECFSPFEVYICQSHQLTPLLL